MHATELAYDLTRVDVDIDGVMVKALVYAGVDNILKSNGKPVAVSNLKATGRSIPSATTRELLDETIALPEIRDVLEEQGMVDVTSSDEYVEALHSLKPIKGARITVRKAVHKALARSGKSTTYKLPVHARQLQSWANPSTIPTFGQQLRGIHRNDTYVLPSTEVPGWDDKEARDKVLGSVSLHFVRVTPDLKKK